MHSIQTRQFMEDKWVPYNCFENMVQTFRYSKGRIKRHESVMLTIGTGSRKKIRVSCKCKDLSLFESFLSSIFKFEPEFILLSIELENMKDVPSNYISQTISQGNAVEGIGLPLFSFLKE